MPVPLGERPLPVGLELEVEELLEPLFEELLLEELPLFEEPTEEDGFVCGLFAPPELLEEALSDEYSSEKSEESGVSEELSEKLSE